MSDGVGVRMRCKVGSRLEAREPGWTVLAVISLAGMGQGFGKSSEWQNEQVNNRPIKRCLCNYGSRLSLSCTLPRHLKSTCSIVASFYLNNSDRNIIQPVGSWPSDFAPPPLGPLPFSVGGSRRRHSPERLSVDWDVPNQGTETQLDHHRQGGLRSKTCSKPVPTRSAFAYCMWEESHAMSQTKIVILSSQKTKDAPPPQGPGMPGQIFSIDFPKAHPGGNALLSPQTAPKEQLARWQLVCRPNTRGTHTRVDINRSTAILSAIHH